MLTLQSEIKPLLPDVTSMGGDDHTINRERLILVLDGLARNLRMAYWIRLAVALGILLVLAVLVFRESDQPSVLAAVVAAVGITIGGAIAALKQVTDEMSRVGLLLAIAPEVTIEALTEMAKTIVTKL
jgi:hypothetical protein